MANYDKVIWEVLLEAGRAGISVQKLARHVYNACNTLFQPVDYAQVHGYVSQFLLRHSKDPTSMVFRADTRGIYRLNPENQESRQLMLQFESGKNAVEEEKKSPIDLSLPLF